MTEAFVKRRLERNWRGLIALGLADEGILRTREETALERVLRVKPNPPQWEDPEDTPFANPVRQQNGEGVPACLRSFGALSLA